MRTTEFNSFELLLMAAAEEVANDNAEEFMAIDTTDMEMSPKADIRMRRYIRKNSKHRVNYKPIKLILVACLVALSVVFTACMAIPQGREAIMNVFVQWYENYFEINFSDDPNAVTTTQPEPEEIIPETPPTTIEKKAYATQLPDTYVGEVAGDTAVYYQINYYDGNGNLVVMLTQKTIDSELTWGDQEGVVPKEVTVNGHKAYLLTYPEEPNVYMLIWQDYYYQYSVYGLFESEAQIIGFCENVKLR